MKNSDGQLERSLYSAFLDASRGGSEALRPRLVLNDQRRQSRVADVINTHLRSCSSFAFSVAFITRGGLATLFQALLEAKRRGVTGRILTSDYLTFTDPNAIRAIYEELSPEIEVRVYSQSAFHTKGYLFEEEDKPTTLMIGSSNITQDALSTNHEWNLQVVGSNHGHLIHETKVEFEALWRDGTEITAGWLEHYSKVWQTYHTTRVFTPQPLDSSPILEIPKESGGFVLNSMQIDALSRLVELRDEGKRKALLVSATGTGKTILAASDVNLVNPERFLFIIHREQIAQEAMVSFKKHLNDDVECAILAGSRNETTAPYLFATIQTLSKDEILYSFERSEFDYIVVDEAHHAPADSYCKVLDYFTPTFLLGMTATPVRPDGKDVYSLFGNSIAAEITLAQALEANLLAPFHYYGITDLYIDGTPSSTVREFANLEKGEQLKHLSVLLRRYSLGIERRRGLIFTSTNEYAAFVAQELQDQGVRALALSGSSSQEERERAFRRLEGDDEHSLEYLVAVNIFNEGVDIPSLNQIVMLRPTESVIVFTQQLGRGLRKYPRKEFLTVVDFVGNHENNYMIPIALFGENSYDKEVLRRIMYSGGSIPGSSTVSFDRIAKERILDSINSATFSRKAFLLDKYHNLKKRLGGKIPTLIDFVRFQEVKPELFLRYAKTWAQFKALNGVEPSFTLEMDDLHLKSLRFLSEYLARGIRIHETFLLSSLIEGSKDKDEILSSWNEMYGFIPSEESVKSALRVLQNSYTQPKDRASFGNISYIEEEGGAFSITSAFHELLQNSQYRSEVIELLELSAMNYTLRFAEKREEYDFVRYEKYDRKEVSRLLGWERDEYNTIFGYKVDYVKKTCPIFVTYHKHESIDSSIAYDDQFIDAEHFAWQSRTNVHIDSKEMIGIRNPAMKKLLFIKKSDDEGSAHYYLGHMEYIKNEQSTRKNDKGAVLPVVNVQFRLRDSVPENLYAYITEQIEDDEALDA